MVLEWTNDGCPFVQKHRNPQSTQKTQAGATAGGDMVWPSVISSKPGSQGYADGACAHKLTKDRGAKPTYVQLGPEGSMGSAYGAKTPPHIYLITPDGKVAYNGSIKSNKIEDIPKQCRTT